MASTNVLDRVIGFLSPAAGLRRIRARAASQVLTRGYDGAAVSRRTQGWRRSSRNANAEVGSALKTLRDVARDLVRNNGYAESGLTTIKDHTVGWGITPKTTDRRAQEAWQAWAESTACDADGRLNFYGLQGLVMRTIAESGEALVRLRPRLPEDGLPLPMQIQVLEPDYIDDTAAETVLPGGGRLVRGIEFDAIGRRRAYRLFKDHPGATLQPQGQTSTAVPAESVIHVYRLDRPGQVRGVSWFAPVMLKFKDFDEFDDATLMKQKIAACLAVITSDVDGTSAPLGDGSTEGLDLLEPGLVANIAAGRTVTVVDPPSAADFPAYTATTLRAIATGLGVTYEDLTGDFSQVNFSSSRMARLKHQARVEEWRWQMLVPLLCEPVWRWAMQAAAIEGKVSKPDISPDSWTAPSLPMIDPAGEGLAYQRNVRSGLMSLYDALRERGYDPEVVLQEIAESNKRIDELGLVLDTDPRKTSQAGQPVAPAPISQDPPPAPAPDAKPAAGKAAA